MVTPATGRRCGVPTHPSCDLQSDLPDLAGVAATTMPVGMIRTGKRYRRNLGDLTGLADSIRQLGLLQAIVVTPDQRLVAGQRRLEACRKLGWKTIPVRVLELDDVLRGQHDENVVRLDFLPSEAAAIADALEGQERTRAARNRGRRTDRPGGKLPPSSTGKTRDRVARRVGVSGRTLDKIRAVVAAARKEPRYRPLVEQMDRTRRVDKAYRQLRLQQAAAQRSIPVTHADPNAALRDALTTLIDDIQSAVRDLPPLAKRLHVLAHSRTFPPRLVGTPGRLAESLKNVEQIQTAVHDVLWRGRVIAAWPS